MVKDFFLFRFFFLIRIREGVALNVGNFTSAKVFSFLVSRLGKFKFSLYDGLNKKH